MNSLITEINKTKITTISVSEDTLTVELSDGRTLSVPLAWYPRLDHGTTTEKNQWHLLGNGSGITWPDLDEDISLENLILGQHSSESQKSLQVWLDSRQPSKS